MGADIALAADVTHCRFSFQQTSQCIAEVEPLKACNLGTKLTIRFDILFTIGTLWFTETATGLGADHLTRLGESQYQCTFDRGTRSMFRSALGGVKRIGRRMICSFARANTNDGRRNDRSACLQVHGAIFPHSREVLALPCITLDPCTA